MEAGSLLKKIQDDFVHLPLDSRFVMLLPASNWSEINAATAAVVSKYFVELLHSLQKDKNIVIVIN